MKILIGLICLSLIWIAYMMVYAPMCDEDGNYIDKDDYDNIL